MYRVFIKVRGGYDVFDNFAEAFRCAKRIAKMYPYSTIILRRADSIREIWHNN